MVATRTRALAAVFLALAAAAPATADTSTVPDEVIVRYVDTVSKAYLAEGVRRWVDRRTAVHAVPRDTDGRRSRAHWRAFERRLLRRSEVLYVEPNRRGRFEEVVPAALPNDPQFADQWWLPSVGAPVLWAVSRGERVTVAVIDSGVDPDHPDLTAALLSNGYDFGDMSRSPDDRLGHGTAVAGIIAAHQNNSLGVSGLSPSVRLLPIKINIGGEASFLSDRLAMAIDYAVAQGAAIINLSLVAEETITVRDAVLRALAAGVLVVAAAGNDAGELAFPASIDGVIAVASTGRDGALLPASNRGAAWQLAAPGESILSTALGGGYAARTGTSFAAPIVTATLAALQSLRPRLRAEEAVDILRRTARPLSGIAEGGRLDSGAAAEALLPRLLMRVSANGDAWNLNIDYVLPATPTSVDLFVAVEPPHGGLYCLVADGSWRSVTESGLLPLASGLSIPVAAAGVLLGDGGVFPSARVDATAIGAYRVHTAYVEAANGQVVGAINTTRAIVGQP